MTEKPTYEELIQRIRQLETEAERYREIEAALRIEKNLLNSLFENIFMGITVWDREGMLLWANKGFTKLTGYTLSEIRCLDDWFSKAFPDPLYRNRVISAWRTTSGLSEVVWEFNITCGNGELKTIEFRCAFPPDGRAFVTMADITEFMQAVEALRQSEARLQLAVMEAPHPVMIYAQNGEILQTNRMWAELSGFEADEISTIPQWIEKSGLKKRSSTTAGPEGSHGFAGSMADGEYHLRAKNGNQLTWDFRSASLGRLPDGRLLLITMATDVTERRRIEDALKFTQFAVDHSSDAAFWMRSDARFIYVNQAACRSLGYSKDELLSMTVHDIDPDFPKSRWAEHWEDIKRRRSFGIESHHRTKGGKVFPVEIKLNYLEFGGKEYNCAYVRDISERKLAEEEKNKLHAQLLQAQKMEAIGTLAGGMAHDFNNLLMGIQGRTSLMLADSDPLDSHIEHLRGIEAYIKSAADLTRQLLGLARGGKYEVKPTDLNELVQKSAQMFGRTKKEITIHTKLNDTLWAADVDRRQIEQVLLNIYVNAWQAMPAGGEIYLQTDNIFLEGSDAEIFRQKRGRYVKISITDTGVGMDKATMQKIFDPFFTTKGMGRGTGLGLASAYGIVKNHGGNISVYSEKGKGATFNIYLPASSGGAAQEGETPSVILTGNETVLLVDDEEMVIDVGKAMLEKLGYAVHISENGEQAVEFYKAHQASIHIVVLDMIMPGMNGGETYDRLKRIDPDVKVLLSSGYSINGAANEILRRGCNGFIQKPFNLSELSRKIRSILDA